MERNDILIVHGTNYKEMAMQILERADLAGLIGDRNKRIALKPNLVVNKAPSEGATTHGEIVEGVLEYLLDHGFKNLSVMESSWVGERTSNSFRTTGYDKICSKYDVPFFDLQKDTHKEYDCRGMKLNICDKALAVDFMINLPVLKGHCQTTITCALKNAKGEIPNSEKRKFHTMGLHKPIAHLNTVVRNDFILVDNICGDLDFEEGGNPVVMNRILGFRDPVLCDSYVCDCMGHSVDDVPYIRMAEKLGVGSTDIAHANIIMLNEPSEAGAIGQLHMTRKVQKLAAYTEASDACSACYGSLIYALDRLDDQGFLRKDLPRICIGQGYKGKEGAGRIGVGKCTAGCSKNLKGCPPKAADVVDFLRANWK